MSLRSFLEVAVFVLLVGLLELVANVEVPKWKHVESGVISLYRPWQKGKFVPYGRYAGAWNRLPRKGDLVCAHRWLKFGTVLRISWKGGVAYCAVWDRGPFGACVPGKGKRDPQCKKRGYKYRVITRKLPAGGRYRGIIDATPAVHRMMQGDGWLWGKIEQLVGVRTRRPFNRQLGAVAAR